MADRYASKCSDVLQHVLVISSCHLRMSSSGTRTTNTDLFLAFFVHMEPVHTLSRSHEYRHHDHYRFTNVSPSADAVVTTTSCIVEIDRISVQIARHFRYPGACWSLPNMAASVMVIYGDWTSFPNISFNFWCIGTSVSGKVRQKLGDIDGRILCR